MDFKPFELDTNANIIERKWRVVSDSIQADDNSYATISILHWNILA